MKRMSAIHPTPQVGEHRLGSSQENRKPLYTHILPDFYSWREEDTQAQQHSGALGSVPGEKQGHLLWTKLDTTTVSLF